jgi:hypothetical protein
MGRRGLIGVIGSELAASLTKLSDLLDTRLMLSAMTALSPSGFALYAVIDAAHRRANYRRPPLETGICGE